MTVCSFTSISAAADALGPPADRVAIAESLRVIDQWIGAQRAYDRVPGLSVGFVAGDPEEIRFERDASGKVSRIASFSNFYPRID